MPEMPARPEPDYMGSRAKKDVAGSAGALAGQGIMLRSFPGLRDKHTWLKNRKDAFVIGSVKYILRVRSYPSLSPPDPDADGAQCDFTLLIFLSA
jgi:hypothetical protein